jgi:hypothetical protein
MTKQEAVEQFKKLTSGLPKEQQDVLAAALSNEQIADQVAEWGMLKADYSREKNAVAAEKKRLEDEYAAKYTQLQDWAKQNGKTIEQAQAIYDKYQKYVANYGELDGTPVQQANNTPSLTPEQLQKLLDEREQRITGATANFLKSAFKLNTDHQKRFGDPLDIDAFESYITEQRKVDPQLGIESAYRAYIEPKLEAKRAAEFEEKVKAAREEGARDALSRHKLPVDPGPKEYSPAWDPERHKLADKSEAEQEEMARDNFVRTWHEAAAKA